MTFGFKCGATGYLGNSLATPLNSRLQIFGSEKWAEATGPETFEAYRECSLINLTVSSKEAHAKHSFDIIDSVAENFSSFADAIEGKSGFIISTDQMIHNIAVVDAIRQSLDSNKVAILRPIPPFAPVRSIFLFALINTNWQARRSLLK